MTSRTIIVIPMSKVEADRLCQWHVGRHPSQAAGDTHRQTLATHAALVKGRKCMHADVDPTSGGLGPICGKGVEKDSPHGWLCWRHYAAAYGIKVPPPGQVATVPLIRKEIPVA